MASIYQSIEILSKEKGIDTQIVIDAVKDAILVAARKQFRGNEELVAEFDEKTGALLLFAVKNVVETVTDPAKELTLEEGQKSDPAAEIGSLIRFVRPTDVLGRIAAQTARQVILQKVREAERENIFLEYSGRVGELVNTTGAGSFEGYYNDEAAMAERMRGGVYHSGDLAYRDEAGYVFFAGRLGGVDHKKQQVAFLQGGANRVHHALVER